MVRSYVQITGDYNPFHFDAEFAAQTRFERLIAQGGITTGLLHALVAMDMRSRIGLVAFDYKCSKLRAKRLDWHVEIDPVTS